MDGAANWVTEFFWSVHLHAYSPCSLSIFNEEISLTYPKENTKMSEIAHTKSWPDLAAGLYDHLTGRGAEISYEFKDMSVKIPSGTGDKAEHAEWVVSGTMTIRTKDNSTRPK